MKSAAVPISIIFVFACGLNGPDGSSISAYLFQKPLSSPGVTTTVDEITQESTLTALQESAPAPAIDTTQVSRRITSLIAEYTALAKRYQSLEVQHTDGDYQGKSTWMFDDDCSLIYMYEKGEDTNYKNSSHYFFENDTLVGLRERSESANGGGFMQIAFKDLRGATYYRTDAQSPLKTTPAVSDVIAAVGETHRFNLEIFIGDMKIGWVENKDPEKMVIVSDRSYYINGKEIQAEIRMTLSRKLYDCLTNRD